jgi:hypothetical protein
VIEHVDPQRALAGLCGLRSPLSHPQKLAGVREKSLAALSVLSQRNGVEIRPVGS